MISLTLLLATIAAGVVVARAVCVINNMHLRKGKAHYLKFLCFGLSYALLGAGALLSMFRLWESPHWFSGNFMLLIASAGLILFDRRGVRDRLFSPDECRR